MYKCDFCKGRGGWETGPHSESCKYCDGTGFALIPKATVDPATIALILSLVSLLLQWWMERKTGSLRSRFFPRRASARLAKLEAKATAIEAWKAEQELHRRNFGSEYDLESLKRIVEE